MQYLETLKIKPEVELTVDKMKINLNMLKQNRKGRTKEQKSKRTKKMVDLSPAISFIKYIWAKQFNSKAEIAKMNKTVYKSCSLNLKRTN